MPHKKSDPYKSCEKCGRQLHRKRYNGRLEDFGAFSRRLFCDRACMAKAMIVDNPSRDQYARRVRHLKKDHCEECGSSKNLHLHHRDRNWANNAVGNLQTLCATCHLKGHWARGDIMERMPKPPCRVCGKSSYRHKEQLCNTCRTRARRARMAAAIFANEGET